MKTIVVMYDSLNLRFLPPYGRAESAGIHAPNFCRLAERTARFSNCYVGSMPCMPARREMQTGRYNLLHRSWGPMEPYDDSLPELLRKGGVYTHLISDHQHYWEDGGATYHQRYSTWEIVRGHEGDRWKASVKDPEKPTSPSPFGRQDAINRAHMPTEADQPQTKVFDLGMEFLDDNADQDGWMLHLETFDPHEPFFSMQRYKDLYPHSYSGPEDDWPRYAPVREGPEAVNHMRMQYAALLSMCDRNLGRVLDKMDEKNLWDDTMLIVCTDHGFLLGEHDWWAKCVQPFYNEVAHTPLFIWDPRCRAAGVSRESFVQTIDLPATVLDFFGQPLPADMQGAPLRDTVASDAPARAAGLFGIFGGQLNVTDGRYVYMRAAANADNAPLYEYTLMPTHMRAMFSPEELRTASLRQPFPFTKGCPLLKIDGRSFTPLSAKSFADKALAGADEYAREKFGELHRSMLFDLEADPLQEHPLCDPAAEARMIGLMIDLMIENDAPAEQFERLGLADALAARRA